MNGRFWWHNLGSTGVSLKAIYPKNHVYQTESGHIKEYDDTPLSERIYESHATGTSYELDPAGNRIDIIKGSSYTLTNLNNHISIGGNSDITIDGRHKVYINKEALLTTITIYRWGLMPVLMYKLTQGI